MISFQRLANCKLQVEVTVREPFGKCRRLRGQLENSCGFFPGRDKKRRRAQAVHADTLSVSLKSKF